MEFLNQNHQSINLLREELPPPPARMEMLGFNSLPEHSLFLKFNTVFFTLPTVTHSCAHEITLPLRCPPSHQTERAGFALSHVGRVKTLGDPYGNGACTFSLPLLRPHAPTVRSLF